MAPLFTLWLLGPTSSGKTTLGAALRQRLKACGVPCLHYDGDEVRDFFGPDFPFGAEHRLRVVQTLCHLANKATTENICCVVSALTANPDARQFVLNNVSHLVVGSVRCSQEECIRRDPKGLYREAIKGRIDTLVGYNSPYVPPEHFDLELETEAHDVDRLVQRMLDYLD